MQVVDAQSDMRDAGRWHGTAKRWRDEQVVGRPGKCFLGRIEIRPTSWRSPGPA